MASRVFPCRFCSRMNRICAAKSKKKKNILAGPDQMQNQMGRGMLKRLDAVPCREIRFLIGGGFGSIWKATTATLDSAARVHVQEKKSHAGVAPP